MGKNKGVSTNIGYKQDIRYCLEKGITQLIDLEKVKMIITREVSNEN